MIEGNIGVVEFKSVARGIAVTDEMIKNADVKIVISSTLCPGKYFTVVEGDVSSVEKAVNIADVSGGRHVYSSEVISGINNKVIDAIGGDLVSETGGSLGIIESMHMASIINSADICVDTAEVGFIDFRLARGGGVNSFYVICGDLSSVREAMGNATGYLNKCGCLIASRIIANPDREVFRWLKASLCNC